MTRFEFKIETVTPMFTSGADPSQFELHPSSLKGLMRFWWRAYYWGKNTKDLSLEESLNQMKDQEGKIFGASSGKEPQKSSFSIRITPSEMEGTLQSFPTRTVKASSGGRSFNINILEYLAYGTYAYQKGKGNVFNRKYLRAGSEFSVILNVTDKTVEQDTTIIEENIITSFYLLSSFGGIGAKSRNGFGNFSIKKIEIETEEQQALVSKLKYLIPFPDGTFFDQIRNKNIPPYTAFSNHPKNRMKIFKLKGAYKSWDECLAKLGEIYRTGKLKLDAPHSCEKRQYIASPIVIQKNVGGRIKIDDQSFLERRSKPYFLKVVKLKDHYDGYILYLPSKYAEGLKSDRYNRPIPSDADAKFHQYCAELNTHLAANMEVFYA